jgi:hypothetical protein
MMRYSLAYVQEEDLPTMVRGIMCAITKSSGADEMRLIRQHCQHVSNSTLSLLLELIVNALRLNAVSCMYLQLFNNTHASMLIAQLVYGKSH